MKKWLWGLSVALLSAPVLAGSLFEHPQTPAQASAVLRAAMPELEQLQLLRGRFVQHRLLRDIPRPLKSSGEFLMLRDRGIWWHTQLPLDTTLSFAVGDRTSREPAAAVFLALFTLDLDTLARSFDLFLLQTDGHWLLGLRPRDAAVAAWIGQITLSGSRQVERVSLLEATGDRSEIELHSVAAPASSLTPVERQRLGH